MYSVYQHWDPLKVCAIGRSYPPEFYSFIDNSKVRNIMERIAIETEEDYQSLITILKQFNVDVVRTTVAEDAEFYFDSSKKQYQAPSMMCPRDVAIMVGETFYIDNYIIEGFTTCWNAIRGNDWPITPPDNINDLPTWIKDELHNVHKIDLEKRRYNSYTDILKMIKTAGNEIIYNFSGIAKRGMYDVSSASISRIGKDLYHGINENSPADYSLENLKNDQKILDAEFPDYRNHIIETWGHTDSCFCPVVPGLILTIKDIQDYNKTFPGWEVIELPEQSWFDPKVSQFLQLKEKNRGKWWVPGEEFNDEFINFVEGWLNHWVGYVEETVFDVNILVIDEHNVICNNENDKVFEAFKRYGITPHVCNFRHRYFWDGGIHCITQDLNREGKLQDYFPNRI